MQQQISGLLRPVKSCPYKTELPPACHIPNTWIATSNTNHYLIPKYIVFKNLGSQLH